MTQEPRSLNRFFRQNWLSLLGIAVGIIGLAYAVYAQRASHLSRIPIFLVDPARVELVSSKGLSDAPIVVLRTDGRKIRSNLVSATFFFWNAGNLPIKSENVLQPLVVRVQGDGAEILDHRVLRVTRDITGFQLNRETAKDPSSLLLSFRIVEPDDGIAVQLLYEGDTNAPITIGGAIEGVRSITTPDSIKSAGFLTLYAAGFGPALLTMFIFVAVLFVMFWFSPELTT